MNFKRVSCHDHRSCSNRPRPLGCCCCAGREMTHFSIAVQDNLKADGGIPRTTINHLLLSNPDNVLLETSSHTHTPECTDSHRNLFTTHANKCSEKNQLFRQFCRKRVRVKQLAIYTEKQEKFSSRQKKLFGGPGGNARHHVLHPHLPDAFLIEEIYRHLVRADC